MKRDYLRPEIAVCAVLTCVPLASTIEGDTEEVKQDKDFETDW